MENIRAACFDVYQRVPINSGGDWYAYQIFSDLAQHAETTVHFTLLDREKQGYYPKEVKFKQRYIEPHVSWIKLSKVLQQIRPDVLWDKSSVNKIETDVVCTLIYSFHIAQYVARRNQCPLVLVMQNIEWEYLKNTNKPFHRFLHLYENHALRAADAVVNISPHDRSYAAKYAGSNKVFYVPPKPDEAVFHSDAASRYDYGNDKLNVLFYGSFSTSHNVEALQFVRFELVPQLKEAGLLRDIRINIFGSGEPPDSLGMKKDPDINFLGFVDDPGPYIRGADVVIAPIKNPSGMKVRIIEALACGKPVVATPEAIAGIPYELRDAVVVRETTKGFIDALLAFIGDSHTKPAARRTIETRPSVKVNTMKDVLDFLLTRAKKAEV